MENKSSKMWMNILKSKYFKIKKLEVIPSYVKEFVVQLNPRKETFKLVILEESS